MCQIASARNAGPQLPLGDFVLFSLSLARLSDAHSEAHVSGEVAAPIRARIATFAFPFVPRLVSQSGHRARSRFRHLPRGARGGYILPERNTLGSEVFVAACVLCVETVAL